MFGIHSNRAEVSNGGKYVGGENPFTILLLRVMKSSQNKKKNNFSHKPKYFTLSKSILKLAQY
jgi:hypothetical protein